MKTSNSYSLATLVGMVLLAALSSAALAQTAPPPAFGEDTKGTPAIIEDIEASESSSSESDTSGNNDNDDEPKSLTNRLLGETEITESRRESGQVYRIELEHSSGSKQYIEETDSDGEINPDGIDLEDTPNLPKWKLGSW